MKKEGYRIRKRYLVLKGLQLRYMVLVLLAILITAVVFAWTVYVTHWELILKELQDLQAQARLADIFKKVNIALFFRVGILMVLAALLSIFLSHRIAGPVFRLERAANQIARGDLTLRIRLRRRDELKSLAGAINGIAENLHRLISEDVKLIRELSSLTEQLYTDIKTKKVSPEEAIPLIRRLNDIVNELKGLIASFKIESASTSAEATVDSPPKL